MAAYNEEPRAWVQRVTVTEFADRIEVEPGFLDSCDPDSDAFTMLHHAAALGRNDLVQLILERGVSIDMPSGALERYPDSDAETPRFEPGYTPLMSAAAYGQLATVRFLLSVGADPLKTDYYQGTALHSAAAGGSVSVVNTLLALGCDPEAECGYKANCEELGFYWVGTPLHIAALCNNDAAVRALIEHGAWVDALGMLDVRRPLHYAAAKGATASVEALLRAGADPTVAEEFTGTPPFTTHPNRRMLNVSLSFFALAPIQWRVLGTLVTQPLNLSEISISRSAQRRCVGSCGLPLPTTMFDHPPSLIPVPTCIAGGVYLNDAMP